MSKIIDILFECLFAVGFAASYAVMTWQLSVPVLVGLSCVLVYASRVAGLSWPAALAAGPLASLVVVLAAYWILILNSDPS